MKQCCLFLFDVTPESWWWEKSFFENHIARAVGFDPPLSIPHCYNLTYISSKGLFSFFVFRLVFWSFLFSSHNLSDAIFFTLPCSFFLQPSLLYLIVFFSFYPFLLIPFHSSYSSVSILPYLVTSSNVMHNRSDNSDTESSSECNYI